VCRFLASARLRRILNDYGGRVQVEHQCFALATDPAQISRDQILSKRTVAFLR